MRPRHDSPAMTPGMALRRLERRGGLPPGGRLDARRGSYAWHERGLHLQFALNKDPARREPSGLARQVFVGPEGWLGDPPAESGLDATVAIRPDAPAPGQDHIAELVGFLEEAVPFVADVADLTRILCEENDVARGALHVWLHQGYPARLVKALVIARELDDKATQQRILETLRSGRSVPVTPTKTEDIMVVARRRADEISSSTGRKITV